MKISVQTGGVTERGGIALAFRTIKAAGFDCVDLNIDQLQNLTWREMKTGVKSEIMSDENKIKEYIDEVNALKAETGLEITQAHSNMPSWLGDFPEANAGCLERIIKCIEISGAVGCPRLIVHPRFMGNINELLTKEEEWNLNLSAGNYSGIIATFSEDDPTSIPYKCTSNAIEFAGMLIVFEGDKMYQLQETEGVWYAFELEGGLGIPTMVPQGLNFSDYEYNADHNMYVPKVKTGAELYYSFGFKDGALSYVMLQTTLDESNPEYYGEFTVFSIYEIGTVEIEIPEYIILE